MFAIMSLLLRQLALLVWLSFTWTWLSCKVFCITGFAVFYFLLQSVLGNVANWCASACKLLCINSKTCLASNFKPDHMTVQTTLVLHWRPNWELEKDKQTNQTSLWSHCYAVWTQTEAKFTTSGLSKPEVKFSDHLFYIVSQADASTLVAAVSFVSRQYPLKHGEPKSRFRVSLMSRSSLRKRDGPEHFAQKV